MTKLSWRGASSRQPRQPTRLNQTKACESRWWGKTCARLCRGCHMSQHVLHANWPRVHRMRQLYILSPGVVRKNRRDPSYLNSLHDGFRLLQ